MRHFVSLPPAVQPMKPNHLDFKDLNINYLYTYKFDLWSCIVLESLSIHVFVFQTHYIKDEMCKKNLEYYIRFC